MCSRVDISAATYMGFSGSYVRTHTYDMSVGALCFKSWMYAFCILAFVFVHCLLFHNTHIDPSVIKITKLALS